MKSRLILLLSFLLASCSGDIAINDPSIETLASAIRAVGYSCASVVNSNELSNGNTSWRVACQDTLIYTANLSDDGNICVTPMPYVDSVVPAVRADIDERCVSPGDV